MTTFDRIKSLAVPLEKPIFISIKELKRGDIISIDGYKKIFGEICHESIDQIRDIYGNYINTNGKNWVVARQIIELEEWITFGISRLKNGDSNLLAILFEYDCWKCKNNGTAFGIDLPGQIITGATPFKYPGIIREIKEQLKDFKEEQKLGTIKKRYSKTLEETYLSQGCRKCDALWGDFPLTEKMIEVTNNFVLNKNIRKKWKIDVMRILEK